MTYYIARSPNKSTWIKSKIIITIIITIIIITIIIITIYKLSRASTRTCNNNRGAPHIGYRRIKDFGKIVFMFKIWQGAYPYTHTLKRQVSKFWNHRVLNTNACINLCNIAVFCSKIVFRSLWWQSRLNMIFFPCLFVVDNSTYCSL